MKQNKNQYESYATALVNNGYIQVKNNGAFYSKFEVGYTTRTGMEHFSTDNFANGSIRRFNIPTGTIKVYLTVSVINEGGNVIPIYVNILNSSSSIVDLEIYGTLWNPYYHIINETEPTIATISFVNYGLFVANSIIAYYVDGLRYRLDLGYFYIGMTRTINLPKNAQRISVYAQINLNALANWYTVYSKIFEEPVNITITMTGTTLYPYASEEIVPIATPIQNNTPAVSVPTPNTTTSPSDYITLNILKQYESFMKSKHDEFMNSL